MLKKLFKYDFYAIFRYWWIIICTQLGASLLAGLLLKFLIENADNEKLWLLTVLGGLAMTLCMLAVLLPPGITVLLCCFRFYKNLFTDEGYLTFTLPVKRRTVLLSKLLCNLLYNAMDLFITFGCVLLLLMIGISNAEITMAEILGKMFAALFESFGGGWILVVLAGFLLLLALEAFATTGILLCITLGATVFKKHKVLGAVGIYYAGNAVIQFVVQFAAIFASMFLLEGFSIALSNATAAQGTALLTLLLLLLACITAAPAVAFYFTTVNIVERKLNLP